MYQYVIAFFSTAILTAVLTKRFYSKKDSIVIPPYPSNPSKIPTLSLDRHNEYMRLMNQWKLNKNPEQNPQHEIKN
jgi:hypothetical protein